MSNFSRTHQIDSRGKMQRGGGEMNHKRHGNHEGGRAAHSGHLALPRAGDLRRGGVFYDAGSLMSVGKPGRVKLAVAGRDERPRSSASN